MWRGITPTTNSMLVETRRQSMRHRLYDLAMLGQCGPWQCTLQKPRAAARERHTDCAITTLA
jgi:hypothetical protein